ncbi:MAG: hypothetical protein IT311_04650 [Anaerolineales bacterium]|nr:hypothetical protein [Anaerolineales bacterium]MCZ2123287.1 hypothetical protein [Anaerolineales bacterium]
MGSSNKRKIGRDVRFIPLWIQIVVSVTAVITAVIVGLTPLGPRILEHILADTATPVIAIPTLTSAPAFPSSPPALTLMPTSPSVETPLPTPTLDPNSNLTPAPSSDWFLDCIDSRIWSAYAENVLQPQTSPCYQLAAYGVNAEGGRLNFISNRSYSTAVESGIFTPWQNWKQVDVSIEYEDLKNSEIWIGFFEEDSTQPKGIVFAIQPGGDVDVRDLPRQDYPVDNTYLPYADGKFNVTITFSGGKARFSVDGQGLISDWPVPFTIKNLFIGYRSLPNTLIDASVYNLRLTK